VSPIFEVGLQNARIRFLFASQKTFPTLSEFLSLCSQI
jgi:hypothetical protein